MTVADVAVELNVTEERVRKLCQQGIMGEKVAGVWLITPLECEAYRTTRRNRGRPPKDDSKK